MFQRSLTAKVLLAVGATVAVVIAIYTYFVIRVQSNWWRERTEAQTLISATMVQQYLEGVMMSDKHDEVQRFLLELRRSEDISVGRIIDRQGLIIFSTHTQEIKQATFRVPEELYRADHMLRGTREENGGALAISLAPVQNRPTCVRCHDTQDRHLGAIVLEKSMDQAEAHIAANRNLLILYGIVIFALVAIVIWLLIVRLVSQPVGVVLEQMRRIQTGDLSARADAKRQDEIGELERGFNGMVTSLDTAKRELQESHTLQIQQAGKLASIGELASGIAHEIRNPLAGIGAAVEVLADNRGGKEAEIVQEIQSQVRRLNTTLCDLLDFARFREPEIAPCDLAGLVQRMLALVRSDAQKAHVRIVTELPADLPPINADTTQAQQALLNVLLNGIQAMPGGGTLTLTATAVDQRVCLSVADTGVGITPENRAKIFSPFFTTKHRGTGLGLAITRTIMEKNGGAIRVASEPGKGATFTLEFAVAATPAEVVTHA